MHWLIASELLSTVTSPYIFFSKQLSISIEGIFCSNMQSNLLIVKVYIRLPHQAPRLGELSLYRTTVNCMISRKFTFKTVIALIG